MNYKYNAKSWTSVDPEKSFTVRDQAQLVEDLIAEIRFRGYSPLGSFLKIEPLSYNCLGILGTLRVPDAAPGNDLVSFSAMVGTRESFQVDKLLAETDRVLNIQCPREDVRLRKEFNNAFERLATIADKLGETVPGYSDFATILRESQRSNILESKR